MTKLTAEQITDIAARLGLELTANEQRTLPEYIERQTDGFSVLAAVDTDGVQPLFDPNDCGEGGR